MVIATVHPHPRFGGIGIPAIFLRSMTDLLNFSYYLANIGEIGHPGVRMGWQDAPFPLSAIQRACNYDRR